MPNALRTKLLALGAPEADLAWFDSFGWEPSAVPEGTLPALEDYRRREALLNASVSGLTFAERGGSLAGRLAAAIGARVADLSDDENDA